MSALARFRTAYRTLAVHVTNALLVVVALFALCAAIEALWPGSRSPETGALGKYGMDAIRDLYPDLDDDSIAVLMKETWQRPQTYRPFAQNRERVRGGRFVNVVEPGYRLVAEQGPWPPDDEALNIFVFGGSTTFGYGVRDEETVVSYLQQAVRERHGGAVFAYNFGAGFYRSTQERALFESLLLDGHVPDVAIFIDGLNDFAFPAGPALTDYLTELFDSRGQATFADALRNTALMRAVSGAARRLGLAGTAEEAAAPSAEEDRQSIDAVIQRYFGNKKMIEAIAEAFGVKVAFVWQPVPSYGYDLSQHRFPDDTRANRLAADGYAAMRAHVDAQRPRHFIWAADLQRGLEGTLYVDSVHYAPELNRVLAKEIVEGIVRMKLLGDR